MKIAYPLAFAAILSWQAPAHADEKEEVGAALQTWTQRVAERDPSKIVALYDKDAMLLATLDPTPITTQEGRLGYFTRLTARPKLTAAVKEEHIRLLDEDNAAVSGIYTFRFEQDGQPKELPARFTFLYGKRDGEWKILEHHSSKLPEKP